MKRDTLVDRLKGYACFLVLFGHVIMGIRLAGIDIPHFFWGMEKFIWSFHVALFLFLSGVVYRITGEWQSKKTKRGFLLHKLYNLGVPYVAFSAVYVLINSLVGGVNTEFSLTDLLYIWNVPIAQYWFLYALFFLFCIWTLCSGYLKNWQITLLAVLIGYVTTYFGIPLGGVGIAFSSALSFGLGTVVDFKKLANLPVVWKCVSVLCHVAVGVILIACNLIETPIFKEFMLLLGIWASIQLLSMLQSYKPLARFFDFVNRYSFQIYLLHTIFTAGIRIVLLRLHVGQWWIHVLVGTLFGLFCSVFAARIAQKVKFLNFFFFSSKTLPCSKGAK